MKFTFAAQTATKAMLFSQTAGFPRASQLKFSVNKKDNISALAHKNLHTDHTRDFKKH